MASSDLTEAQEAWVAQAVEQLLSIPDESSRRSFLQQNPQLQRRSAVLYLATQASATARENTDRALQFAAIAGWVAEVLHDDYCRGRSARAMGHALQLKGKFRESLAEYQKALGLFEKLQDKSEVGITLSGSLQPLILLGDYEEARLRAEKARKIFKAQGDDLRLARLDVNLGNILNRQDRFEDALVLYRRAEQCFQRLDAADDLAFVLNNIAVCCIGLLDFDTALEAHRRLRSYSERRHLQLLTVQADYNIAYVHYFRGEYHRAIDLYKETQAFCARVGDPCHAALCDLDLAEIYLHLNSHEECARSAQEALAQFQGLKMNYETGKAYTILGLLACRQFDSAKASELFAKAADLFLLERNWLWPALIDLYRAILISRAGSAPEALKTLKAAQNILSHSALKEMAALAELFRSLLHLELGDSAAAAYWAEAALQRIESSETTEVRYLAERVLGRIRESQNDLTAAHQCYERAKAALENLPDLHRQGMVVPLLQDTNAIHQHLASLALRLPGPERTQELRLSESEQPKDLDQ